MAPPINIDEKLSFFKVTFFIQKEFKDEILPLFKNQLNTPQDEKKTKTSFAQHQAGTLVYCITPKKLNEIMKYSDISDKKYFRIFVRMPLLEKNNSYALPG
jgi:hypothetical protein